MLDQLTQLETHSAFPSVTLPPSGCRAIAFDVAALIWVNDQFGVEQGDRTLVAIAGLLRSLVVEFGGRVFRYAGDEFLWIIPDQHPSLEDLARRAFERCAALLLPYRAANTARDRVMLNASLLTLYPGDLDSPARLRERVADAIYEAKVTAGSDVGLIASVPVEQPC
jgi:diguanylate cyclase (GGDEF)-like protein